MSEYDKYSEIREGLKGGLDNDVARGSLTVSWEDLTEYCKEVPIAANQAGITMVDSECHPISPWKYASDLLNIPVDGIMVIHWVFPEGDVYQISIVRKSSTAAEFVVVKF